jgi:hypothetical protein
MVRRRVGGFRKGPKRGRGIKGGCSRNRGSRFKVRGFCKGLYSRLLHFR